MTHVHAETRERTGRAALQKDTEVRRERAADGDAELGLWTREIGAWRAEGRDVYAYFDNDIKSAAPFDALELQRRLAGSA